MLVAAAPPMAERQVIKMMSVTKFAITLLTTTIMMMLMMLLMMDLTAQVVERVAAHHAFLRQQSNLLPNLRCFFHDNSFLFGFFKLARAQETIFWVVKRFF